MPSEKQIEAAARSIVDMTQSKEAPIWEEDRKVARAALSAAEQAEPDPALLDGDEQAVYTDPDGKVWHPHRGYWCWKVSHELTQAQKRIKELEAEPAPAARSGAVKVKAVLELVQYHVTDDDDRATLTMAISALEPAEPATDAEPVAWGEDIGGKIVSVRMDKSRHCTVPLYTHPPESRLREALEGLLAPFADDPCRLDHHGYCQAHFLELHCCVAKARATLEQEDGR